MAHCILLVCSFKRNFTLRFGKSTPEKRAAPSRSWGNQANSPQDRREQFPRRRHLSPLKIADAPKPLCGLFIFIVLYIDFLADRGTLNKQRLAG